MFNLVSNAIKYNKEGGYVRISCERDETSLTLVVEDSGIGIEEDNLDLIFTRFKRIETNAEEGQGLGLAIAKSIVDFHEARIEVHSIPGEGSQFNICFPG